jgi:Kef-type K+ transport system membrane component KefB
MSDIDNIIEAIVGLFIICLLGYVFFLVFMQLSPILAVVFIIAIALIAIGMILGILRGE